MSNPRFGTRPGDPGENFRLPLFQQFLDNLEWTGNDRFPLGNPFASMVIRRTFSTDYVGVFYNHPMLQALVIMEVVLVSRLKSDSAGHHMRAATKVIVARSDVFP